MIGPDAPAEVISTLEAGGCNLDHHVYEMEHSQTMETMIDARAWLSNML